MKKYLTSIFMISLALVGCKQLPLKESVGIEKDITAPYINIKNYEYTTSLNKPVDFSNVTGYDDVDGLMKVNVVGYIDYTKVGDYFPLLTCRDTSGNESSIAVTVHVIELIEQDTFEDETIAFSMENTCNHVEAKAQNVACDIVIPSDLENVQTAYFGIDGMTRCEAAILSEKQSCIALYRNDGEFWGYGLVE